MKKKKKLLYKTSPIGNSFQRREKGSIHTPFGKGNEESEREDTKGIRNTIMGKDQLRKEN